MLAVKSEILVKCTRRQLKCIQSTDDREQMEQQLKQAHQFKEERVETMDQWIGDNVVQLIYHP